MYIVKYRSEKKLLFCKLSAKEDRAYFVGHSFDGKDKQGETACHMCGKSFK